MPYRLLACFLALLLAACGGTAANPPAAGAFGPSPGYMLIAFDVAAPVNFAKYRYEIVFNTSGNGLTPEAPTNSVESDFASYSYTLEAGGGGVGTLGVYHYLTPAGCPACFPFYVQLLTTPSQLQYVPDSNGAGTEFTILLQRSIFTGAAPTWLFNAFTTKSETGAAVDSMGRCNKCFVSPQLHTDEAFSEAIAAAKPGDAAIDPAARIVSIHIANDP